jgi:hypothetical protein
MWYKDSSPLPGVLGWADGVTMKTNLEGFSGLIRQLHAQEILHLVVERHDIRVIAKCQMTNNATTGCSGLEAAFAN